MREAFSIAIFLSVGFNYISELWHGKRKLPSTINGDIVETLPEQEEGYVLFTSDEETPS
jgi:hypothetical protein